MTLSLKHAFESEKADGDDATLIQPSNWNEEHVLTQASARLLGRLSSGNGATEELTAAQALGFIGYPPGYIYGLTLSNNVTDAANDIDIAAGSCRASPSSSVVANIDLAATLTKRLDAAWAVGSGNGGLDTGSIADTSYHVHLIRRSDTGVVDALFSASATAPTLPGNYDSFRRIGSFKRVSSSIWSFKHEGDRFTLSNAVAITTSASAQSSTLVDAQVPAGIAVDLVTRSFIEIGTSSGAYESLGSAAMGSANIIIFGIQGSSQMARGSSSGMVRTNTSAQVYRAFTIQAGTVVQYNMNLLGYLDRRG